MHPLFFIPAIRLLYVFFTALKNQACYNRRTDLEIQKNISRT